MGYSQVCKGSYVTEATECKLGRSYRIGWQSYRIISARLSPSCRNRYIP